MKEIIGGIIGVIIILIIILSLPNLIKMVYKPIPNPKTYQTCLPTKFLISSFGYPSNNPSFM